MIELESLFLSIPEVRRTEFIAKAKILAGDILADIERNVHARSAEMRLRKHDHYLLSLLFSRAAHLARFNGKDRRADELIEKGLRYFDSAAIACNY